WARRDCGGNSFAGNVRSSCTKASLCRSIPHSSPAFSTNLAATLLLRRKSSAWSAQSAVERITFGGFVGTIRQVGFDYHEVIGRDRSGDEPAISHDRVRSGQVREIIRRE